MRARTSLLPAVLGAVAISAGAISGFEPIRLGLVLLATCIVGLAINFFRVTPLELMVIAMPFMFYAGARQILNVAASDFLIPVVAISALHGLSRDKHSPLLRGAVAYPTVLSAVLLVSAWVNALLGPINSVVSLAAIAKVTVGGLYLVLTVVLAGRALQAGDYRFLKLWTATAVLLAAVSMAGTFLLVLGESARASGSFEDPNLFGSYLAASLAISMFRSALVRRRLLTMPVAVLAAAAVATGSRGTTVGLSVMLITALVVAPRGRWRASAYASAAVGVCAWWLALSSADRMQRVFSNRLLDEPFEPGSDIRFFLWNHAVRLWEYSPLVGIGPGQFQLRSVEVTRGSGLLAHNTFLSFLSESGIVGLLVFVSLPVVVAVKLLLRARRNDGGALALLLGLAGLLGQMMSLNLQNVRFVWVYLGCCIAFLIVDRRGSERAPVKRSHVEFPLPDVSERSGGKPRGRVVSATYVSGLSFPRIVGIRRDASVC